MSLLQQPMFLLFLEFTITASAIGFTDPHSPLRLACLPSIVALTWIIITTSIQHMRSPWAALTGGYASTYLLHYITIALLCKRSYPDHSTAPSDSNNETFVQRRTQNPQRQPTPTTFSWARLKYGFQAASSFRWNDDETTKPTHHHPSTTTTTDPNTPLTKQSFILNSASTIALCYLTLDLLSLNTDINTNATLFSPSKIPLLTRLHEVTCTELVIRVFSTLISGVGIYALQQSLESLYAILSVSTGMSEVNSWSPRFGPISHAYSLRRFWGYVSHPASQYHLHHSPFHSRPDHTNPHPHKPH